MENVISFILNSIYDFFSIWFDKDVSLNSSYYIYLAIFLSSLAIAVYFGIQFVKNDTNKVGDRLRKRENHLKTFLSTFILRKDNKISIDNKEEEQDYHMLSTFKKLVVKWDVLDISFNEYKISFSGLIIIILFIWVIFVFLLSLFVNPTVFALMSFPIFMLMPILITTTKYEKKKRLFENSLEDIGLIAKQLMGVNASVLKIFQELLNSSKKIIVEEFSIILEIYNNSNDLDTALSSFMKRYPESLYLKTLKDLFLIYAKTYENVSHEIDTLTDQAKSIEKMKSEAIVQFSSFVRNNQIAVIIVVIAILGFIFSTEMFSAYYKTKSGISVLSICSMFVVGGLGYIQYTKVSIVKDNRAKLKKYIKKVK